MKRSFQTILSALSLTLLFATNAIAGVVPCDYGKTERAPGNKVVDLYKQEPLVLTRYRDQRSLVELKMSTNYYKEPDPHEYLMEDGGQRTLLNLSDWSSMTWKSYKMTGSPVFSYKGDIFVGGPVSIPMPFVGGSRVSPTPEDFLTGTKRFDSNKVWGIPDLKVSIDGSVARLHPKSHEAQVRSDGTLVTCRYESTRYGGQNFCQLNIKGGREEGFDLQLTKLGSEEHESLTGSCTARSYVLIDNVARPGKTIAIMGKSVSFGYSSDMVLR
jgi:hypothetical protein